MLTSVMGAVAFVSTYDLLQPVAMGPTFEPHLSPNACWYAKQLFFVPLLLVGAALALVAQ